MKLTKKIVSLTAALALSCTFAVSAENAKKVEIAGDIALGDNGKYSVNLETENVVNGDQYTILVYKISDDGIAKKIASGDITAPEVDPGTNTETSDVGGITYINQDVVAMSATDAYTIAFALGANIDSKGTYRVVVGGTDITIAAVGYFEVGDFAPAYTLGDVDNNGVINATDAGWILSKYGDAAVVFPCGVDAAGDVDGNGTINATDAGWVLSKYGDASVVFPAEQ